MKTLRILQAMKGTGQQQMGIQMNLIVLDALLQRSLCFFQETSLPHKLPA